MVSIGRGVSGGTTGESKETVKSPEGACSPRDRFDSACKRIFVPAKKGGPPPSFSEMAYRGQVELAEVVLREMITAGLSREEFVKMLLLHPLEQRWDILEYRLLSTWNTAAPQFPISIEELKRAKGAVEQVRTETRSCAWRRTMGHK